MSSSWFHFVVTLLLIRFTVCVWVTFSVEAGRGVGGELVQVFLSELLSAAAGDVEDAGRGVSAASQNLNLNKFTPA